MMGIAQERHLRSFLAEVYRWNARVNLTAVPEAIAWDRHVVEALELLRVAPPRVGASLVDVGSGLGVPGIPLAVCRPDLRVTLVEADVRKAGFLTHVAGMLGLGGVRVSAQRAEVLGRDPGMREGFDVAVSRGTAPAAVLCELCLPLVRPGGFLAALVTGATEAAALAVCAAAQCGGDPPRVATDQILVIDKRGPTSERYPRRTGVPSRHPLLPGTSAC